MCAQDAPTRPPTRAPNLPGTAGGEEVHARPPPGCAQSIQLRVSTVDACHCATDVSDVSGIGAQEPGTPHLIRTAIDLLALQEGRQAGALEDRSWPQTSSGHPLGGVTRTVDFHVSWWSSQNRQLFA